MVCINVKKAFDTVNRGAFYIQDLIRFQFWTILHEKKLGTFLRPQHIKIANPLEKTSAKFNATNGGSPSTSCCCFFCLPLLTSAWHLYKYCENVWPQSATLCPKRCFLIQTLNQPIIPPNMVVSSICFQFSNSRHTRQAGAICTWCQLGFLAPSNCQKIIINPY